MEFLKEKLNGFLKNKTIAFYVALGVAGLSLITAVVYAATLSSLTEYMSWGAFAMLLVAPIAFAALAFFGFERIGAAVMGVLDFAALLVFLIAIYKYPISLVMTTNLVDIPGFGAIVAVAAMTVVCFVTANVCVWMKLAKQEKEQQPAAETAAAENL
ncbi:MAG: hypothetical protein HFK08_01550 [Clostridia bacterium]|jgi:hypothetical protein|nr:hypothetical protein [Clostridia bacterium]